MLYVEIIAIYNPRVPNFLLLYNIEELTFLINQPSLLKLQYGKNQPLETNNLIEREKMQVKSKTRF